MNKVWVRVDRSCVIGWRKRCLVCVCFVGRSLNFEFALQRVSR